MHAGPGARSREEPPPLSFVARAARAVGTCGCIGGAPSPVRQGQVSAALAMRMPTPGATASLAPNQEIILIFSKHYFIKPMEIGRIMDRTVGTG